MSVDTVGRWSVVQHDVRPAAEPAAGLAETTVERVARALLDRYGVVFRAIARREAWWLPPWRDLARLYRRLEARGEMRGDVIGHLAAETLHGRQVEIER